MKWQELIRSHEYAEAIHYLQRHLAANPGDMAAVSGMARALRAAGEYDEALSFFERLATHRRQDKVANIMTPGSAPWNIEIACLRWLGGDHLKATELMNGLAAGILTARYSMLATRPAGCRKDCCSTTWPYPTRIQAKCRLRSTISEIKSNAAPVEIGLAQWRHIIWETLRSRKSWKMWRMPMIKCV